MGDFQTSLATKHADVSPGRAVSLLATLQSADIILILLTTDGREIRPRRITQPNSQQKLLLDQLGISLPKRLSFDSECSADSVTA